FSSDQDVSDRVYITSPDIIRTLQTLVLHFLKSLEQKTGLKNFPLHLEVRISAEGQLIPIEVNPLRFGGFCTTGDQSYYAYGFNAYLAYLRNQQPNWEQIFPARENHIYSLIVLDNNSGIPFAEIAAFDYALLAESFEDPLVIREVDFQRHPLFGFVFTRTKKDNLAELERILKSDLRSFIRLKS
ncbi:MAG: ATP-grasp domain-containing protein, partial [Bacteroidota bacterium]